MKLPYSQRKSSQHTRLVIAIVFAATGLSSASLILGSPQPVYACSCIGLSVLSALQRSDAVFQGIVTATNPISPNVAYTEWSTDFQVSRKWKGLVPAVVHVVATRDDGSCGIKFNVGKDYIVYGIASKEPSVFHTVICLRTGEFESAEASALDQLFAVLFFPSVHDDRVNSSFVTRPEQDLTNCTPRTEPRPE